MNKLEIKEITRGFTTKRGLKYPNAFVVKLFRKGKKRI